MKRILILFMIIIIALTVSAQNDTVSVADNLTFVDSVSNENNSIVCVDSAKNEGDSIACVDSVRKRKIPWYMRAYRFIDHVLSPPRDTNYIDVQDYYNWQAMVQVTTRFELFNVSAGNDLQLSASPEWRTRIGPFFGWRFLFLGYNIDIKSLFMNSDDTDLGASIYSSAFGIDLFYRRVGGQYNINKVKYDGVDYTNLLRGQRYDGMNVGMTRVSFYYIVNYKHYSHQAAFNQTHRQIRSAGSLILGAQYAHNRISFDWEKMADMVNSSYGDNTITPPKYSNLKNNEYSLTIGYGYNWVFSKNWLAAGELTGALGYLVQKEKVENKLHSDNQKNSSDFFRNIEDFGRKNIAFNGNLRFSVLWNNGPWFAGTQGVMFYYQYGNGNVVSRNLLGCFYAFVGFNF